MRKPGRLEQQVLFSVLRHNGHAYGVNIQDYIRNKLNEEISLGAIYTTLKRMEEKGYVSSTLGDPTPERGGRAKKLYRIEAPGQQALNVVEEQHRRMWGDPLPQGT